MNIIQKITAVSALALGIALPVSTMAQTTARWTCRSPLRR